MEIEYYGIKFDAETFKDKITIESKSLPGRYRVGEFLSNTTKDIQDVANSVFRRNTSIKVYGPT